EGDVLRVTGPEWQPHASYQVYGPAYVEVADGVSAHISGAIGRQGNSGEGLFKLGGGGLRLSGPVSYMGSTRLLQGGLHVDGSDVFGNWSAVEAAQGTLLQYSAGTRVARSLTFIREQPVDVLPSDVY